MLQSNKHTMIDRTKKTLFIVVKVAIFIVLIFPFAYLRHKLVEHKKFISSVLHTSDNVLGASTNTIQLSIDFEHQIAIGSPLVFGGASNPYVDHIGAWDLLQDVGFTSIRRDFWIETELPANISLDDYKSNKNNVQNPETWNWSGSWNNISIVNKSLTNTKDRGMKTIAILSYSPKWLTYSGTEHGVPRDWDVYQDVVKKLYRIHRPKIDMIEIWNEPTYPNFLDLTGSPYKNKPDAYKDIFLNASQAIKAVDNEVNDGKQAYIIAVVGHTPYDTTVLETVLADPIASSRINAVSYHNYHIEEPSSNYYKSVLSSYGRSDLPLFVTEWNFSPDEKKVDPHHVTNKAISYTGKKLIGFLNQGLAGANYFSVAQNDPQKHNNFQSAFGIYNVNKFKQFTLLPQGKTWQLLSKSLGLGGGSSKIYRSTVPSPLSIVVFENNIFERGLAIANDGASDTNIDLPLNQLGANDWDTIKVFSASANEDGKTPCVLELVGSKPNQSLWITVPAESVVGITLNTTMQTPLGLLKKMVGTTPSKTCAILK